MIVTSTEFKNNLGKYLRLASREDIIITKNGKRICKLSSYGEELPNGTKIGSLVKEQAAAFNYDGKRVSYEEFLEISRNSEERYEYIDGEIYLLSSPKTTHQRILMEMSASFYNYFKGKKCTPLFAPYDINLNRSETNKNVVQPDLMVICDLEEKLGKDDYYMGVPALIVEITSEATRRKDYVKKLDLYMSTGVSEYWIVNPGSKKVHVFSFENHDISRSRTFSFDENIQSYLFDGLTLTLKEFK